MPYSSAHRFEHFGGTYGLASLAVKTAAAGSSTKFNTHLSQCTASDFRRLSAVLSYIAPYSTLNIVLMQFYS